MSTAYQHLINSLNKYIQPLSGVDQYNSLLEQIGDARFVLIGEASHGTHEFYQTRVEITQELIAKKGFMGVAIEGDWPDAYRIHRYVQGFDKKENELKALDGFKRFPTWMWRNTTIPPFIKWLREYNDKLPMVEKVGFYGLDLYSLYSSVQAVIAYLEKIDPEAAQRAKLRYSCFDHQKANPQTYGYLTSLGLKESCRKEVIEQLLELQRNAFAYIKQDGIAGAEEYFFTTQNANVIKDAEKYYRSMFEDNISSWNIRDTHMADTLTKIADHLENRTNKPAKLVIWAHNSHVGDARATEVAERGEINIGQLVRERYDADTYLIGFSTYQGYVTAASEWDQPAESKKINPGFESSYEELFHDLKYPNFILHLKTDPQLEHWLEIPRLQRAIGVIYLPETERYSHYYFTHLPYQFDSLIHLDQTTAVKPIDINPEWLSNKF